MNIDEDDLRFLRIVDVFGGSASTPELRMELQWTPGKTRSRHQKLDSYGLIETEYGSDAGSGAAPRVAVLTHEGEQLVRRRREPDDDETKAETTMQRLTALEDTVEGHDATLSVLTQQFREQDTNMVSLDEDVEYVYRWMGLAERYMKTTRYIFEEMNVDFDAALEAVDDDE